MARQWMTPEGFVIDEDGTDEYILPVGFVMNEDQASGFVPYPNPRYSLTSGMQPMSGGV